MAAGLPADHRRGRVRVDRDDVGHDRGVRHPQPGDAVDAQRGIDDRVRPTPMRQVPTGWNQVLTSRATYAAISSSSATFGAGEVLARVPAGKRRLLGDLPAEADGPDHRPHVVRVAEVVGSIASGASGSAAVRRTVPRLFGRVIPGMIVKRGRPSFALRREVGLLGERDLDVAVGAVRRRAGEGAALGAVGVESEIGRWES